MQKAFTDSCCIIAPTAFANFENGRSDCDFMRAHVHAELSNLVQSGVLHYHCDLAYGAALFAGLEVLRLQESDFPDVRLIAHVPYRNLAHKDHNLFMDILKDANERVYHAETYSSGIYLENRRAMIDQCDIALFICPGKQLYGLVKHAIESEKQVIVLNIVDQKPIWIRDITELLDMCSGNQPRVP